MSLNRFSYRVVTVQDLHVTFVNGKWNGKVDREQVDVATAFTSCPMIYEYLEVAGADGWELVTVNDHRTADSWLQNLYLKRSVY